MAGFSSHHSSHQKGSKVQDKWQLFSVCSILIVFPKHLKAQRKWQQIVDYFVVPTKLHQAWDKWQLTLACTRASLKRPQTQHTQWPASDHIRIPPNQLYSCNIKRTALAGTRDLLRKLLLFAVSPQKTACPCSHGQPSEPVSLRVNPTH